MTYWRDHKVFVTGATGLLGSWLVEQLLAQGASVTCLIRDSVPKSRLIREGLVQQVTVVRGAIEDFEDVLRALNEYEIQTVFHLGAQTIVGTAARSVLSTYETNVKGTWTLLEACRHVSTVKRIVVASSDKAYGSQSQLPYREDAPLAGRFPYDASKSCADLIAQSFFHSFALPVTITRCGNLFGGGDLNWSRIVPGTMRSALNGERPIIRSDGTLIRDYFYVEDAARAYVALAENMLEKGLVGQAFNFGSDRPFAVIDMVRLILRSVAREDLEPIILNEASREIEAQYLDSTKARAALDWSPQYPLEDAMVRTAAWYRNHLKLSP